MVYLLLAVVCSALISVIMRISEKYISHNFALLAANYITCTLFALILVGPDLLSSSAVSSGRSVLPLGLISGVFYLVSFILLQLNVSKNGVILSSTFMKLGVLVPTLMAVTLFSETPKLVQILGFLCALAAILLIHFEGGATKAQNRTLLLILLICAGIADSMSKFFEFYFEPGQKARYLLCTFLFALILCMILIFFMKQRIGKWELLFGFLLGIPNYLCSHFLLQALDTVPAVVTFPTYSVGTIVLVTLAGLVIFRETLTKKRIAAIAIILLSLVLLNI